MGPWINLTLQISTFDYFVTQPPSFLGMIRVGSNSNSNILPRVGQISLYDGPLASFGECGRYIDLFVAALRNYGMLCIGLYRYVNQKNNNTIFSEYLPLLWQAFWLKRKKLGPKSTSTRVVIDFCSSKIGHELKK